MGFPKKNFKTFQEAKEFIKPLKIESQYQWRKYSASDKRPQDIPSNPNVHYKDEWTNWYDWLGIDINPKKKYKKQI